MPGPRKRSVQFGEEPMVIFGDRRPMVWPSRRVPRMRRRSLLGELPSSVSTGAGEEVRDIGESPSEGQSTEAELNRLAKLINIYCTIFDTREM